MRQLDLAALASDLEPAKRLSSTSKSRGITAKKQKVSQAPTLPRRTTRSSGIASEDAVYVGGVDAEERGGRITLATSPWAAAPLRPRSKEAAPAPEPIRVSPGSDCARVFLGRISQQCRLQRTPRSLLPSGMWLASHPRQVCCNEFGLCTGCACQKECSKTFVGVSCLDSTEHQGEHASTTLLT
jgi:hypothetical protein